MVNSRRGEKRDAPLDVEWWAVTIDWGLIGFDQRRRAHQSVPVALYPTNLVQLLQFWIPRSKQLEASLVDSVRLPLFFADFDPDDERATLKILEVISRFENLEDLSDDAVERVLTNQALRGKIKEAEFENQQVVELIREELVEENRRTSQLLTDTQRQLSEAQHVMSRGKQETADERAKKEAALAEGESIRAQLNEKVEESARVSTALRNEEGKSAQLQTQLTTLQNQTDVRTFVSRSVLAPSVLAAVVAIAVPWLVGHLLPAFSRLWLYLGGIGLLVAGLAVIFWRASKKVAASDNLRSSRAGRSVLWLHNKIFIGGIVGSLLVVARDNSFWDLVKSLFPGTT